MITAAILGGSMSADVQAGNNSKERTSKSVSNQTLKSVFQSNIGKYPTSVRLLDKPALKNRLIRLIGAQKYATMKKYWQVETPIEFSNWNFYTSGFEAHNAGENEFEISYNPETDNLCVKYIIGGRMSIYKEKSGNAYWDYQ